jgi:peptidoglycan hydrolase-like protein with peptidoglycan-binding domain
VVSLQSFLEAKGFLVMPAGVAKGYFGGLTKTAVVAYQASKGLPTTGFFGPMTNTAAWADVSAMGTTGGTTTGGTTGGTTTTGGVTFTNPGEGFVDVRLAATPADNADIRTSTDVPVYGLELRARQADVAVQRVDLQVDVTAAAASETPSTLINTIKVWDGSSVIATFPVSTGTFTKDSSNRYYVRLTGFNFVVPKDTTKVLTVSFSTNSIDTSRITTVRGYLSQSVRATDSTGVSTFYDASTLTRTHTFVKPGSSSLTLASDAAVLRAQNYKIPTEGTTEVVMTTFNVKSTVGDSVITQVNASVNASGSYPTALSLYDGSTLLSSKSVTSLNSSSIFDNLTLPVGKEVTKTLTLKATYQSTTASGSAASTTVTAVTYDKPNGSSATVSASVNGPEHRLFSVVPKYTLSSITTSNPTIGGSTASSSDSQYVQAVFTFNVMANGATLVKPVASDFTILAASSSGSRAATVSSVTVNNNRDIADGGSDTVTVVARLDASNIASGNTDYNFAISSIKWGFVGYSSTTQSWGLEDYRSGPVTGSRK